MIRLVAGLAVVAALALAPSALADSSQSTNWAGYAVHRSGVKFRQVDGTWTAPSATCAPGKPRFSSVWVGLGGYNERSTALEQIGTETDCKASGRATTSAWFELVPAPSRRIKMTVRAGDRLRASVNVTGREVRLRLVDLTRHKSFERTINDSTLDLTSAEWIVEAPSECFGNSECQTLPLANFGSATITAARAVTRGGYAGSIVNRRWVATRITLAAGGQRRLIGNPPSAATAVATPSALLGASNSFTVTYGPATTPTPTASMPATTVTAAVTGQLFLHSS